MNLGGGVDTNFQSIAESEPLNNLITSESGFRGLCTDARGDPEDIQCGLRNAGGSAPWPDDVRGGPVRGAAPGGGVGVVCERRGRESRRWGPRCAERLGWRGEEPLAGLRGRVPPAKPAWSL